MKVSSKIFVSVFCAFFILLVTGCESSQKSTLEKKKVKVPRPCIKAVYLTDSTIVIKGRNLDPTLKEKSVKCDIKFSNVNGRRSPEVFVLLDVTKFRDSICQIAFDDADIAISYTTLNEFDSTGQLLKRTKANWNSKSGMYFISNKKDRVTILKTLPSLCEELFATVRIESEYRNRFYQRSLDTIEYRSDELFYGITKLGFEGDCREERFPDDLYYYQ